MAEAKKSTILCVDDDEDMRDWISLILMQKGYDVQTAESGEEALKTVGAVSPDVILLDVTMPGMDGYQVCAKLQEDKKAASVPVIFVTGRSADQDKAKAFQVGAADYLVKPLNEKGLSEKVQTHLATHRKWQELQEAGKAPRKAEPITDPGTARWDSRLRASEFTKFKRTLVQKLKIPLDRASILGRMNPMDLYTRASELGVTQEQVAEQLAAFLSCPQANGVKSDEIRLGVFPSSFCKSHRIVPVADEESPAAFVLCDPFAWEVLEALKRTLDRGQTPKLMIISPSRLDEILQSEAGAAAPDQPASTPKDVSEIAEQLREEYGPTEEVTQVGAAGDEESAPIINLVNRIIETAHSRGASDIHIEPQEEEVIVRYRIDGDLQIVNHFKPAVVCRPLVARIKIMSDLDIAEKRLPQDGRIKFKKFTRRNDMDIDLRVATAPQNHGEKVCMRILDKQKSVMPLEKLGFSPRNLEKYRSKIKAPYGMILHCGPTGSGKSMSLYAALNEIMDPEINIQTAEDPIEYTLPGINQLQVQSDIGLNFQRALRSFLRLDPDVILVGEIRDHETAKMAVEASLTGHLLFSTLHTNDAGSTITRLIEMGIEPYLVGSSLLLICAQRLLRRLCGECKEKYSPDPTHRKFVGAEDGAKIELYQARGCPKCGGTGYKGRVGIHEVMVLTDELRTEINRKGVTAEKLKRIAVEKDGMTTLYWDAMIKVREGLCSVDDTLANVLPDEFDSRPAWINDPAGE